jgi:hypothetical protein
LTCNPAARRYNDAMKKLIEEVDGEGYMAFVGKRITLFCDTYIYTGKLVGVSDQFVKLADPAVVYETGAFTDPTWKDAQALPHELYVNISHVESFGELK